MAICGGTLDWRGETVAILGTGPSLTQSRAQACRDRFKVVAINRATDLAPWADWAFFSQYHEMIASSFAGLRTAMNGRGPLPDNAYFVDLWSGGPLLAHSDLIRAARNAAWAAPCRCGSKQLDCRLLAGRWAIEAVARTGAARILLLGFDGGVTVAGAHFYESTPAKPPEHDKLYLAQCWPDCARVVRERGVEVINCSPGTMMAAFPSAWLGEVLHRAGQPRAAQGAWALARNRATRSAGSTGRLRGYLYFRLTAAAIRRSVCGARQFGQATAVAGNNRRRPNSQLEFTQMTATPNLSPESPDCKPAERIIARASSDIEGPVTVTGTPTCVRLLIPATVGHLDLTPVAALDLAAQLNRSVGTGGDHPMPHERLQAVQTLGELERAINAVTDAFWFAREQHYDGDGSASVYDQTETYAAWNLRRRRMGWTIDQLEAAVVRLNRAFGWEPPDDMGDDDGADDDDQDDAS